MTPMELVLTAVLAGMATAIATGKMEVPTEVTNSSISISFMLIVALVLFAYSPVVGIASIVLFAVMLYSRNVLKLSMTMTRQKQAYENPRRNEYGDMNIYAERNDVMPYGSMMSGPRQYSQFRETTSSSWMPTLSEGFRSGDSTASYASFGSDQYAAGQFPIDTQRVYSNPYVEEYKFRPSLDTGDNEFKRYGPNMDSKLDALAYH